MTETRLEIILEHLPPSELNPNNLRRQHWTVRHRVTQEAKDEIGWLAKIQWGDNDPLKKARISYEFHSKDRRRRDLDNILSACKAYQDGLIEAGILTYDDAAHLEIGSVTYVEDIAEKTIISIAEV